MEAIMAKPIRGAVTACCERVSFIFRAPIGVVWQRPSTQSPAFRHPIKVATIPLQWNPKPKMISRAESYFAGSLMISIRLKRRL
jgi:hypothetical protein